MTQLYVNSTNTAQRTTTLAPALALTRSNLHECHAQAPHIALDSKLPGTLDKFWTLVQVAPRIAENQAVPQPDVCASELHKQALQKKRHNLLNNDISQEIWHIRQAGNNSMRRTLSNSSLLTTHQSRIRAQTSVQSNDTSQSAKRT